MDSYPPTKSDHRGTDVLKKISHEMEWWLKNHSLASNWVIRVAFDTTCRQNDRQPSHELASVLDLSEPSKGRLLAATM